MSEASIPVDLFNPGQVFACLGFLEAADVLCGQAEGGFDWSEPGDVRFKLRAGGDNPFAAVLGFLAGARVQRWGPVGYADPPKNSKQDSTEESADSGPEDLETSELFPGSEASHMALPIRLVGQVDGKPRSLDVGHWADGSSRERFKLYAGNRSAASIARAMLHGTRAKPKKNQTIGDLKTKGLSTLWLSSPSALTDRPFDVLTPVAGSFNFDPRGAWTAIDAGYSPDEQNHNVVSSPVVEILAAIGLEHGRPEEFAARQVRYAAWKGVVPPSLARPALAASQVGLPLRTFRFEFGGTKYNKVVTFAQEETRR